MIKAIYDTQEEIPEKYRELFEERGGKWHLVKIDGIKTDADVSRVQRALESEKSLHGKTKEKLAVYTDAFGERTADEIQADLDRIPELETRAKGNLDEAKINELVEQRIKTKIAPVERERDKLKTQVSERDAKIAEFETADKRRKIHDAVRSAAVEKKVHAEAVDDILVIAERLFEIAEDGSVTARDSVGVTPGISPVAWLEEIQPKRSYWWPASNGGGAKGSGAGGFANNPWSAEHWNMTEQVKVIKEKGEQVADKMAKSAGSSIDAVAPPKSAK